MENNVVNKSFDEFMNNYIKRDEIEKLIDELEIVEENNRPNLSKRYDLYVTRGFSSGLIFAINKIKELLDK